MTNEEPTPAGNARARSGAAAAGGDARRLADGGVADDADSDVVRRERFAGGPARSFLSSMDADARLFDADLAVDRAHVVMLAEQGIVDEGSATAILDALAAIEAEGVDALPEAEDIHAAIETAVIDRVGAEGGRMHTARSRNDEVVTCIRHRLRSDLLDAVGATVSLRESLLDVAERELETTLPGYTHRQPAQPTTVAHWCCSYAAALERDTSRLFGAYGRTNRSPLGAAALAGTPYPIDRDRTAALLGFDDVVENAMDAASSRAFALEAVGALAGLSVTGSGLAADLIDAASRGLVTLDDDYASTSSIMPQKKNPDTLELVRAVAGDAIGSWTALATTLKGLPRAYNRDLQRATPHVWHAVDAVTQATDVASGAVATATWNRAALERAAGDGFATATGVADRLAMAGVPFRTAHAIVADAARALDEADASGDDVGPDRVNTTDPDTRDAVMDALDAACEAELGEPLDDHVDRSAIAALLDPAASVASRDSFGGPAPPVVAESVERARAALDEDRAALESRRSALADARDALDAEVAARG